MSAGFIVRSAAIAVLVYGFIGGGASIAQAQVNPPSGSLSAAELDTIAADIREVIRDPLAPGADEKRETLFQWIQASPDVDVIVCPNILGPVAQLKDHPYRAELVSLAVLAGAAHNIESPDSGHQAEQMASLNGLIRAYQAIKEEKGKDVEAPLLEAFVRTQHDGTLEVWVRDAIPNC